ncbi:MAG: C25 family cysteine peptidase [Planctomycetota bacterium]|jgi:hypothetical protein
MKTKLLPIAGLLVALFLAAGTAAQDNLLIITPDEFLDEVNRLKEFKQCSARPTIVEGLNHVYSTWSGYDKAEKVKRCIDYYKRNYAIDHVLLVGDVDKFPVRWRWFGLYFTNPGGDLVDQLGWSPSDLYYADLYKDSISSQFDTWDSDNDSLWGEIMWAPDYINNDGIDYLPDVTVGRIPASTSAELTAYINKVIRYEIATRPDNAWFKRAGLYTGVWHPHANIVKDTVDRFLSDEGFTIIPHYSSFPDTNDETTWTPPPGMPHQMIVEINSGFGFVNYIGHADPNEWSCLHFERDSLVQLTNSTQLPVVSATGCMSAMFAKEARIQPYLATNGIGWCGKQFGELLIPGPHPHPSWPRPACIQTGAITCNSVEYPFDHACIGEEFIFGRPIGPTGAIAYLGARTGTFVTSRTLDSCFYQAYHEGGHRIIGNMWKHMIEHYYVRFDLKNSDTWCFQPDQHYNPGNRVGWQWGHVFDEPQKFHLLGDPSLYVGGAFTDVRSGVIYDWDPYFNAPWFEMQRYRIIGDITIPLGEKVSVRPAASIAFDNGKKITALGVLAGDGLIVDASAEMPACFMAAASDPYAEQPVHGIKVSGQLRLQNGGEMKLY